MALELFTMSVPETGFAEKLAQRAEAGGWDGISLTDSQNLVGDPFVAMALGARVTEHLQFMTGVTNPATRHPAALATAIATVQEVSGGRAVLGIGRGDTALFHLGRPPMRIEDFFARTREVHAYLRGETIDVNGHPSRLRWLDRARQPAVPVDIAASGPKVIAFAARTVERITFAVGADPDRLAWALDLARTSMRAAGRSDADVSFGAYVNVGCHPDADAARDLIRGTIAAFAHFSAMPGSTGAGLDEPDRAVVAEVGRRYDSNRHLFNTADHSSVLPDAFIDRFGVVGDAEVCARRLRDLGSLGLDRLVISGPTIDADPTNAQVHHRLVGDELLRAQGLKRVRYRRMPIEVESPEQLGYDTITNNLSESSVADRRLAELGVNVELDHLLLCYGDHLGDPALREAIASAGDGLCADDVLVTPGAAAALFCTATSLLDPGDHVVVVRTNYATNLETPRAIGADVDIVDLAFDDGWRLDVERLAARVRPGVTRLISVTCPHNPTGTMLDLEQLHALVELAERSGAVLLVDETYRDLTHVEQDRLPIAAGLSTRAVSVSSMSKAYGLPGLRVGWAICRDPGLAETLLAAKEQMLICGPTLDEAIAGRVLAARPRILPPILEGVRAHLAIVRDWLAGQDVFEWVEPTGGVVGLVRVRPEIEIDTARFHGDLLADHGTYVGPGHWFELDDRHFRLGFGWPTGAELGAGLAGITKSAAASM